MFLFRLIRADGAPADPPTIRLNVYRWHPGETIALGKRNLRVVGSRDDDADQRPVLVVEGGSE